MVWPGRRSPVLARMPTSEGMKKKIKDTVGSSSMAAHSGTPANFGKQGSRRKMGGRWEKRANQSFLEKN
jgi:hypothetical protein